MMIFLLLVEGRLGAVATAFMGVVLGGGAFSIGLFRVTV